MKINILTALPIVSASVAIVYVSSLPGTTLPNLGFWNMDKLLHFGAYFFYGLLLQLFFRGNLKSGKASVIILSILFGVLFALSDEIHQSYVPGRLGDVYDFAADSLGIIASTSLYRPIDNFVEYLKRIIADG